MNDKATILAVDDTPAVLRLLVMALTQAGYEVRSADTGEQALAAVAANPPDLILLDVRMKGLGGLDVCRQLKAREETRHIPIILISGFADVTDWVEGVRAGAADFINKPFLPEELLTRIGTHLALRHVQASLERQTAALRQTNEQLQSEIRERQAAEHKLGQSLDHAERSRRALLSALEDQKRTEEELKKRNAFVETILANSPIGFAVNTIHDSQAVLVSRNFERIYGIAPDSVHTADDFFEKVYLDPAFREQMRARVTADMASGDPARMRWENLPITTATGERKVVTATNIPVLEQDLMISTVQDVTERWRAQDDLRQSEEKFSKAFQTSPYAITITRARDGRFVEVNDAFTSMTGFTREEARAGSSVGLQLWVYEEERQRILADLRAGHPVLGRECAFRTKNGAIITGLFSAQVIDLGGDACVLSSINDITTRKRAERAVRASEERFRTIFESNAAAIGIVERDSTISMVNREYCRLSLFEEKDVVGTSWTNQIHPDDLGTLLEHNRKRLLDPKSAPDQYEFRFCRKDGAIRHCLMSVATIPMTGQMVCSVADITDRKRMEDEREKLEDQLRTSQKLEAIGSLAGGIAHDFNNLLSVILSYTAFALEGVRDGDPVRGDLAQVQKAAERAAALTRHMLAFGRKQVLQPVALDLNQIAQGVEKMLQRIVGEDIDLVHQLAPDLGLTLADPGRIEQVLMNLVVNAREAMPRGGRLTIATANAEIDQEHAARQAGVNPGRYVELAVTDTGSGMDAKTLARMFEPFFTTKEKGRGTGLGLSTAYGVVKQSGGNIWVQSEPGRGTTFKVYLPRTFAAATATIVPAPTGARRPTGTETVLVVDDEEALGKIAERTLRKSGYTVLTAASADEALLAGAAHPGDIHLLLTDVIMPKMNGRALAHELSKTRPAMKVLYMSGYSDDAISLRGVLEEGTSLLEKPFTATELARKVRAVLDGGITDSDSVRAPVAQAEAEPGNQPLDENAVRAVAPEIVSKLRAAVIAARYDEILELVESIRPAHPDLSARLRRMAVDFDYEGMQALLSR
jgi:two-component system, cell cycle sensor histidine kinase and response regulator CckA